jgi:hypothetical protein
MKIVVQSDDGRTTHAEVLTGATGVNASMISGATMHPCEARGIAGILVIAADVSECMKQEGK